MVMRGWLFEERSSKLAGIIGRSTHAGFERQSHACIDWD
jgi:hypothetical protein